MRVFLIAPLKSEFRDINAAIREAVSSDHGKNPGELITPEDFFASGIPIAEKLSEEISNSDMIIAEISESNSYNLFEVGIAKAMNKPILFIAQRESELPLFIVTNYIIQYYDRNRLKETLVFPLMKRLSDIVLKDLKNEKYFVETEKNKTVFISYSHADRDYLNRLCIHLRPFEKGGQIDIWSDTKIKAGEKWKQVIENALNKAAIAILLISADFLASDFIVDNELQPLLKYAEQKGTVILPVILKPCLFTHNSSLSQFQSINDPKLPLSKLNENDKEEIYVRIAEEVFSLINK